MLTRNTSRFIGLATLAGIALTATLGLSGCDSVDTPLAKRADRIVDMGRVPLPNSSFQLHGYRLDNGMNQDHFVYVLEDAEQRIIAGTRSNQYEKSGKTTHNAAVSTELAPTASEDSAQPLELDLKVQCSSIAQCQRKLAALNATR